MGNVTRHYVLLPNGRQLHYLKTGAGPALVMLHASPQNAESLGTSIKAFSPHCTCIAFDTPGYGQSDALASTNPSLRDYGNTILQALTEMGIENFCLYGAATGSQIAIQMAKDAPERVHFLMLDSNGHVSADVRETMLKGYFPDVTPRRDGGHLLTYWDMVKSLFVAFPWTSENSANQLKMDLPPPEVLQEILVRYMQAGSDYALAYKEAFYTENIDHLQGLNISTIMTRWLDSPVLSIMDALLEYELPKCVSVLEAGRGIAARFAVQREALVAELAKRNLATATLVDQQSASPKNWRRKYYRAGNFHLHGIEKMGSDDGTLVMLHGAGGSAERMLERYDVSLTAGRLIALDLPCHGHSDRMPEAQDITLESISGPILDFIQSLGDEGIQIMGEGLGAEIANKVAEELEGVEVRESSPLSGFRAVEACLPDLEPNYDGTHLVAAWSYLKDRQLFKPWNERQASNRITADINFSPEILQRELFDLLRVGKNLPTFAHLETR